MTKADLERALALVRDLGLKPSAVEVMPGMVRILTSAGPVALPAAGADNDGKGEDEWGNI